MNTPKEFHREVRKGETRDGITASVYTFWRPGRGYYTTNVVSEIRALLKHAGTNQLRKLKTGTYMPRDTELATREK